jgi:AAA ATPase domain
VDEDNAGKGIHARHGCEGVGGVAGQDAGLMGRDAELARLRGLVDPPPPDSRVLLLLGDAGMGKTALLAAAGRLRGW